MTPEQFSAATEGKRLTSKVRRALRMVMVEGRTWRDAAHKTGVHESSIMRAKAKLNNIGQLPVIEVPKGARWFDATSYTPMYPNELGTIAHLVNDEWLPVYRFITKEST